MASVKKVEGYFLNLYCDLDPMWKVHSNKKRVEIVQKTCRKNQIHFTSITIKKSK